MQLEALLAAPESLQDTDPVPPLTPEAFPFPSQAIFFALHNAVAVILALLFCAALGCELGCDVGNWIV